jgi:hypothetical protein
MKMLVTLLALGATVGLTACASTTSPTNGATPYQAASSGKFGFTDQRIESNRFRIIFEGNTRTTREQVEDRLLLRAADVTIENGYDWFEIAQRATDPKTFSRPRLGSRWSFATSYSTFHPRYGWVSVYDPFWPRGPFDPFWDASDTEEVTRFRATAEIILGKGPKPADRAEAFDARDVRANLASRVIPPVPVVPAPADTTKTGS